MADRPLVLVTHQADESVRRAYSDVLAESAQVCFLGDLGESTRDVVNKATVFSALFPDRELATVSEAISDRLELLQLITSGANHVDLARWPKDVLIATSPGAQSPEIAEHALALMLAGAKNLFDRHVKLKRGEFDQFSNNRLLAGAICGIIGFGGIGKATARLCRAFGMEIHALNRSGTTDESVEFVGTLEDLPRVLAGADFVVLSIELTTRTANLIGASELALMKPDAVLVNVARAGLVSEDALYRHLREHPSFVACVDAWWKEPSTHGSFSTDLPLLELPNLIGSPHNASRVPGITAKMSLHAALNIYQFLVNGLPDHVVDPREKPIPPGSRH